jgi:hypothetical protein
MSKHHAETEPMAHALAYDEPTTIDEHPGDYDEPFIPKQRYRPARSTKILACAVLVMAGLFGGTLVQKAQVPGQPGARSNFSQLRNGSTSSGSQDAGAPTRGARGEGQGQRAGQPNP